MSYVVACLDVYDDRVQKIIRKHVPENWEVKMATSYSEEDQQRLTKNADCILAGWSPVPDWMLKLKKLKFVQKFGVGYDKIPIHVAEKEGVSVAIASGLNAVPVSELVMLLVLSLYRKFLYLNQTIRSGKWVKSEMRSKTYQIYGKTVGLVGLGSVGKEVAARMHSFGADVLYYDEFRLNKDNEEYYNVKYCPFKDLLQQADIVSLHVPYTDKTAGLINRETLSLMKQDAILINTARGELVEEADLTEALRNNQLLGAGIDVYTTEPILKDHSYFELNNLVMTPHIGGTVLDNVERMANHCFRNMERFFSGESLPTKDVIVIGSNWSDV